MVEQSTQQNADTFFGDGEVSYRTFPTPEFIWSVVKRNAVIVGMIAFLISPVVLLRVLTVGKIYESSIVLKFDAADSFQVDNRPSEAVFAEVVQYLSRELEDQTFLGELAQRFPPTLNEYPAYMLAGRYPELQIVRWFISAPQKDTDPVKRGKYLRSRVNIGADTFVRGNTLIRVTSTGPTMEDAQKLATTAVELLSEKFYAREVARVAVGVGAITDFVNSEKVRTLVENARKESLDLPQSLGSTKNSVQALKDIKNRQQLAKSRIREINEEIRTTITRRTQLEASLAELSRRYGPFHPERKAVENEIAEMRGRDGMAALSRELRNLESQLADAEADADSIVAAEETEERADKMILKIYGRLDRLKLEQEKLEEQIAKPSQRTRLAQMGPPSTPLEAQSKRLQVAIIGVVGALGLGVFISLIREIMRKDAIDKWRIDWILNAPCLARFSGAKVGKLASFEKKSIQNLRQRISSSKKVDGDLDAYLNYRTLGVWVRNHTKGQVVLFLRSSQNPTSVSMLYRFAAVYSRDYAGKYLVLDMNATSGSDFVSPEDRSNTLLEVILQKTTLEAALGKSNQDRGFDLLVANQNLENRLSEVLSSAKFAEFMISARRIYHKIFIIGLTAPNFVENNTLLTRSSECLAVVDTQSTNLQDLRHLRRDIEAGDLAGYVLIEK